MTSTNLFFKKKKPKKSHPRSECIEDLNWKYHNFLIVLARLLLLSAVKWGYGICFQISHFLIVSLTEKYKQGLSNKRCDEHKQRTRNPNYFRNPNATALFKDDSSQKVFSGQDRNMWRNKNVEDWHRPKYRN